MLAPHADDETLGCGALIARKRADGVVVVVVIVTDGTRSDRLGRSAATIAAVRREEALNACGTLGVDPADVHFLGLPDGLLDEYRPTLVDRLDALAATVKPEEVLVCSALDQHPDHVALWKACTASHLGETSVFEYLVWAWSAWPAPMLREVRRAPRSLDGARGRLRFLWRLRRSHAGAFREKKAAAIQCYDSQMGDGRAGRGMPVGALSAHMGRYELLIARPRRVR